MSQKRINKIGKEKEFDRFADIFEKIISGYDKI